MADLPSFLSGLLGALIGVAASLFIYVEGNRRRGRAAVLAALQEADLNQVRIDWFVQQKAAIGLVSDELFKAYLVELASRLSPADFQRVVSAYAFVPAVRDAMAPMGGPTSDVRDVDMTQTAEHLRDAVMILRRNAERRW
jgi:hypothetical protein